MELYRDAVARGKMMEDPNIPLDSQNGSQVCRCQAMFSTYAQGKSHPRSLQAIVCASHWSGFQKQGCGP
jgi:hypothetical protein